MRSAHRLGRGQTQKHLQRDSRLCSMCLLGTFSRVLCLDPLQRPVKRYWIWCVVTKLQTRSSSKQDSVFEGSKLQIPLSEALCSCVSAWAPFSWDLVPPPAVCCSVQSFLSFPSSAIIGTSPATCPAALPLNLSGARWPGHGLSSMSSVFNTCPYVMTAQFISD